jgi:Lysozyme like domain
VTSYSYSQLEGLWINAGGPRAVAALAAAIAEAESGGNSQAVNRTDNNGTQTSWGLWQISNGTHGQPVPDILDPAVNAQQAVAKYNNAGHQFTPWGTYDTGAYKAFLSGSTTPDTTVPGLGAPAPPGTAAAGATCLLALPSVGLGPISTPQICLIDRTEARAVLGAVLIASGGLVLALGVLVLAAYGLKSSGAGKGAGRALEVIGAGTAVVAPEVGAPVAAAGATVQKAGTAGTAAGAARRRTRSRQAAAGKTKASQAQAS